MGLLWGWQICSVITLLTTWCLPSLTTSHISLCYDPGLWLLWAHPIPPTSVVGCSCKLFWVHALLLTNLCCEPLTNSFGTPTHQPLLWAGAVTPLSSPHPTNLCCGVPANSSESRSFSPTFVVSFSPASAVSWSADSEELSLEQPASCQTLCHQPLLWLGLLTPLCSVLCH
jgi:hypothetical protein